ncbi:MAG TPA: ATP-dependent helicase, partial [Streptosporangiaceae bacterium]
GRTTRQPLALTFHSYAYALVRREFVLDGEEPPTLLSGPEQLLEVRRLLRGEAEDGGGNWPERLRPALATRGFAAELRDFLLRAAERGLDGRGLARLGAQRQRDDWIAAGGFLDRYASRFDLAPVPAYDYAEIVRIAARLLGRAATRDRERQAYDVVLVDEYQDTDPAQENLLHALAGNGRELIAVGDPDQSIYGFRGADTRAVSRFASRFLTPDGSPARVIALRTCRRSGPFLLTASRRVATRLPAVQAHDNPDTERQHRALVPRPGADPGTARIIIAATANQEATAIADALRRAHLMDGLAWSSMAVLVRSATRQVPVLQRALGAAGVPVQIAGDELPLAAEPGTRPLLMLLDCALRPGALDEDKAAELLTGPLGGTDALGLRRLRRALRVAAPAAGDLPSEQPLAAALADPRELTMIGGPDAEADVTAGPGADAGAGHGLASAVAAARRVAALLALAAQTAENGEWRGAEKGEWRGTANGAGGAGRGAGGGGTAHDVLWAVWDASGLAGTWQQASAAGGSRGAAADADLDAVLALFDAAARFSARFPQGS